MVTVEPDAVALDCCTGKPEIFTANPVTPVLGDRELLTPDTEIVTVVPAELTEAEEILRLAVPAMAMCGTKAKLAITRRKVSKNVKKRPENCLFLHIRSLY
jgi:hypothetical protein